MNGSITVRDTKSEAQVATVNGDISTMPELAGLFAVTLGTEIPNPKH